MLLAKIDCEAEQDIVARFGIQSLPTVVLFKDGQPVDGFAGAQPESAVRAMLEPHVQMPPPAAADPLEQAQALFGEGRILARRPALLVQLLGEDNTNAAALILYARCLAERGELGEARPCSTRSRATTIRPPWPGPRRKSPSCARRRICRTLPS